MSNSGLTPMLSLIGRSFRDTRGTVRMLNALKLDRSTLWTMLALVCILRAVMFQVVLWSFPDEVPVGVNEISLFVLTAVLGVALLITISALHYTGQMLGGTGRFDSALLLVIWWQVIGLVLQIAQFVAVLIAPFLTIVVALGTLGFMIYSLLVLVDVLNGFGNLFKALLVVILAGLGVVVGLSVVLVAIGVTVSGGIV